MQALLALIAWNMSVSADEESNLLMDNFHDLEVSTALRTRLEQSDIPATQITLSTKVLELDCGTVGEGLAFPLAPKATSLKHCVRQYGYEWLSDQGAFHCQACPAGRYKDTLHIQDVQAVRSGIESRLRLKTMAPSLKPCVSVPRLLSCCKH